MKNKTKFCLSIVGIVFSIQFMMKVEAEEVSNQNGESPVVIQVNESPIRFSKVIAPMFGTYDIEKKSKNQEILANGDLIVQVVDTRESDFSSWGIQYELSLFKDISNGQSINSQVIMHIGSGELLINGEAANPNFYQKQEVTVSPEKTGLLVQTTSSLHGEFLYRVPKERIKFTLLDSAKAGSYQAVQTITLTNVPVIDEQ